MSVVGGRSVGLAAKRRLKLDATLPERTLMVALDAMREPYAFQHVVRTDEAVGGFYVVDFLLPRRRIMLEVDGASHFTAQGRWNDRLRDEALERAKPGHLVVHVANADVTRDAAAMVRFLRSF